MANPVETEAPAIPQRPHQRRRATDRWQQTRRTVQLLFVALNVYLCWHFYLFVRHYETFASGPAPARPAGVDGWLPIAGLMNTRYLFATGRAPAIHPAAMVLFLVFLSASFLLKRAFCSWLCPVGTLSEFLWKLGRRLFGRNLVLPRWLDIPLRSLKYLLMGFFVFIVGSMSATALDAFMHQPYGILVDVKMLHFFTHMSETVAVSLAVLMLLSVVIRNFWCRYLCPYGAVMSLASLFSPVTIRRDTEACIQCGNCSRACPQQLPVDRLVRIRSVECTACMECVSSCGTQNAIQFALPPAAGSAALPMPATGAATVSASPVARRWRHRALQPMAAAAILAALFFGGVSVARLTHHWQTNISPQLYRQLIPNVDQDSHPGF